MALVVEVLGEWWYWCPGCQCHHTLDERWEFDGDFSKPSFRPSVMVGKGTPSQCHSWIDDGMIHFMEDCVHELQNRTVPMESLDVQLVDE